MASGIPRALYSVTPDPIAPALDELTLMLDTKVREIGRPADDATAHFDRGYIAALTEAKRRVAAKASTTTLTQEATT